MERHKNIYNDVWALFYKYIEPMKAHDNIMRWQLLEDREAVEKKYLRNCGTFAEHLTTAVHYELMDLYNGKTTGRTDYLDMYKDVCGLFKQYFNTIPADIKDGNYWKSFLSDAMTIERKYNLYVFCHDLIMATSQELERLWKEKAL